MLRRNGFPASVTSCEGWRGSGCQTHFVMGERSGCAPSLRLPSRVTTPSATETRIRAVGLDSSRPVTTSGADSFAFPSAALHSATISLRPGRSGTRARKVEPSISTAASTGSSLTRNATSPQLLRPCTTLVHEKASPPSVSNATFGDSDAGAVGEDPVHAAAITRAEHASAGRLRVASRTSDGSGSALHPG